MEWTKFCNEQSILHKEVNHYKICPHCGASNPSYKSISSKPSQEVIEIENSPQPKALTISKQIVRSYSSHISKDQLLSLYNRHRHRIYKTLSPHVKKINHKISLRAFVRMSPSGDVDIVFQKKRICIRIFKQNASFFEKKLCRWKMWTLQV